MGKLADFVIGSAQWLAAGGIGVIMLYVFWKIAGTVMAIDFLSQYWYAIVVLMLVVLALALWFVYRFVGSWLRGLIA